MLTLTERMITLSFKTFLYTWRIKEVWRKNNFGWSFLFLFLSYRRPLCLQTNKIPKKASIHLLQFQGKHFVIQGIKRMSRKIVWKVEMLPQWIVSHDFFIEVISTYFIEQKINIRIKQGSIKRNFHHLPKQTKRLGIKLIQIQFDRGKFITISLKPGVIEISTFLETINNYFQNESRTCETVPSPKNKDWQ